MIARLQTEIKKKNAPVVVGLDPQLSFLPEPLLTKAYADCGRTPEGAAEAFFRFNQKIVDAIYDLVPAVKPQIAMYELLGIPGLAAYKKTIDYCHEKGLLVIGDIKRGDIGSTSAAYARGHLGTVSIGEHTFAPFAEDFATVNPYLGTDGIAPFLDICREEDKGIFVLVKTSNPSSGEFQDLLLSDGTRLYEAVAAMVNRWGAQLMEGGDSNVGAVVGATYPEIGRILRAQMPNACILVPGYGAQGACGKDLAPFFRPDGTGAIVNSSRGIIAAYREAPYAKFGADGFADASRAAVLDMLKDIQNALG